SFPASKSALDAGDGLGTMGVFTTDLNAERIDVGHPGTLKVRCTRGADLEVTPGREQFTAEGGLTDYPWQEGGSGIGNGYDYPYGNVPDDFAAEQQHIQTGGVLTSISGSQASGNLIRNGDFDTPISGTRATKLPQWNITSGDTNISQSPAALNGVNSIRVAGAATMEQDILEAPTNGVIGGIAVKAKVNGTGGDGVTGSITVSIMSRDESATYGQLVFNVATTEHNLGNVLIAVPG